MYPFPFPFALQGEQGIGQRLVALRLPAEFAVALPPLGGERTLSQCALDGAARLARVRAIAVAARCREDGDLIEGPVDRVLAGPKLEFAHARSVDQGAARGQFDEFPVAGGMASAAIGFAHFRRAQAIRSEEHTSEL